MLKTNKLQENVAMKTIQVQHYQSLAFYCEAGGIKPSDTGLGYFQFSMSVSTNGKNGSDLLCKGLWDLLMEVPHKGELLPLYISWFSCKLSYYKTPQVLKHPVVLFNNSLVWTFCNTLKNSTYTFFSEQIAPLAISTVSRKNSSGLYKRKKVKR